MYFRSGSFLSQIIYSSHGNDLGTYYGNYANSFNISWWKVIILGATKPVLQENAKKATKFLKVVANENRLVILCALAEGEKNVGELEEILEIHQPTLSQQLSRLRNENLVRTRRNSKQIYYRIASDEAVELIGLMYDLFCSEDESDLSWLRVYKSALAFK